MTSDISDSLSISEPQNGRRWLVLGAIGIAQLMVVLDLTVVNVALPSAQRALTFATVDRQWVVTAYSLAFGSLLLLGGRLADLLGRKVTFLAGLAGFAAASAVGGASVNFAMLVAARACQGAFAAIMVPSALSLLATTFIEPKDRGRAFGIYGAIAVAGGAIGLLLGGALTEYLSWRWTLYVNLVFATVGFAGGALLLRRQPSPNKPRLDIPGVLLVSSSVFCLVYGCSNAATDGWGAPSTYGFLAAGVTLLAGFALWQGQATHLLLPPRVVLDRNRGGAYMSMFVAGAGLVGTFLFLSYYMQLTLGYSPLLTGFAFLPVSVGAAVVSNLSTIVLLPRFGPKPLVALGMLVATGAMVWLAQLGAHDEYVGSLLGPLIMVGIGMGMVLAPLGQHRYLRRRSTGRGGCIRDRHGEPDAGRLGRHLAAQHNIRWRRDFIRHRASDSANRPPDADRAGVGARLRHSICVDRCHFRWWSCHRRRSLASRTFGLRGHAIAVARPGARGSRRD